MTNRRYFQRLFSGLVGLVAVIVMGHFANGNSSPGAFGLAMAICGPIIVVSTFVFIRTFAANFREDPQELSKLNHDRYQSAMRALSQIHERRKRRPKS